MNYRRSSIDYDECYEVKSKLRSRSLLVTKKEKKTVECDFETTQRNFYEIYINNQELNRYNRTRTNKHGLSQPRNLKHGSSCGNVSQRVKLANMRRFSKVHV